MVRATVWTGCDTGARPHIVKAVLDRMVEVACEYMTMISVTPAPDIANSVTHCLVFINWGEIVLVDEPDLFFADPQNDRARTRISQILDH